MDVTGFLTPNLEKFLSLSRSILRDSPQLLARHINVGKRPAGVNAFEPSELEDGGALARHIRAYPAQVGQAARQQAARQCTMAPDRVCMGLMRAGKAVGEQLGRHAQDAAHPDTR